MWICNLISIGHEKQAFISNKCWRKKTHVVHPYILPLFNKEFAWSNQMVS